MSAIYDADLEVQIDRLHDEAEALAAEAKVSEPAKAASLREQATRKVREAARLRARLGKG